MSDIIDFKDGIRPKKGRKAKGPKKVFDTIDVTKLGAQSNDDRINPKLKGGSIESGERLYLSEKHEQYCRYRADSYSPARAYALVYPDSGFPGISAAALEKKEEIKERISQLQLERASMAKLVDPQESLVRWNEIFLKAQEEGDIATAIVAQKQIDKINGAEQAVMKNQLENKGLFRGDSEEAWVKNAANLFQALFQIGAITPDNSYIKERLQEKERIEQEDLERVKEKERIAKREESIPQAISVSGLDGNTELINVIVPKKEE